MYMNEEFFQYLKQAVCIEDVLVLAYASIYTEFCAAKVNNYKPENHKEIQEAISMYFELRVFNTSAIELLKDSLISLNAKKGFSFEDYYCIIEFIDLNYEYNPYVPTLSFNSFKTYSSLSKIYDEPYVYLIPKVKNSYVSVFNNLLCVKENQPDNKKTVLRSTKPYDRNSINSYLSNLILIHKDDISNRKIIVHEYNKNFNNDFCQQILDRKSIEVVTVPLIHQQIRNILNISEDEKYFWISGMREEFEPIILNTYLDIIRTYKNTKVDFIIFPEMFLSENILKRIQEYLLMNDNNDKLQIYILGTIWSDFSNKAVAITSEGEYIFSQYKTIPFDNPDHKEEKLNQKEHPCKIHLIDFPDFARINTFICREIEDDALTKIPKQLESNIVFSPAFSQSLDMKTCPTHLASNYHCLTIVSNACSARYSSKAVEEHKSIGFLCQPSKKGTYSSCKTIDYCFTDNCKNCKNDCKGITISIKFDEIDSEFEKTYCTKIE